MRSWPRSKNASVVGTVSTVIRAIEAPSRFRSAALRSSRSCSAVSPAIAGSAAAASPVPSRLIGSR